MARQTGKTNLVGRVGNLVYYKMDGKYYARAVSSLNGKRVKRDPKFKRTMEFAKLFGKASKLASAVHRSLPNGIRSHKLYQKMAGKANQLLMQGLDERSIDLQLREFAYAGRKAVQKVVSVKTIQQKPAGVKYAKLPCNKLESITNWQMLKKEKEKCITYTNNLKLAANGNLMENSIQLVDFYLILPPVNNRHQSVVYGKNTLPV